MINPIDYVKSMQLKSSLPEIRVGDTVRVYQKIVEGSKERTQAFEGVVIKYSRKKSATARLVVRKTTNGVSVEKSWFVHSPLVSKIDVLRRVKIRRAYLTYLRQLSGKATRLKELKGAKLDKVVFFDKSLSDQAKSPEGSDVDTKPETATVES